MKILTKLKNWKFAAVLSLVYGTTSLSFAVAPDTAGVPQVIPIPDTATLPPSGPSTDSVALPPKTVLIRGPEKPVSYAEKPYLPVTPNFYLKSQELPLSEPLKDFIRKTLIPKEALYFKPDVGMDEKTGMPYDHIRLRLKEKLLSEVGNYTAASKLSLLIPYLLKVIQGKPELQEAPLSAAEATAFLKKTLLTILDYIGKYPEYGGFLPWVDIRPNATIAPASTKLPSLDNGQMTWALAATVAGLEDSPRKDLQEIASLASTILSYQNYRKFYDPEKKLLHGTIQYDPLTQVWSGDKTYYLNDMFEGTMAVLWGVLNGQIPEEAWDNLAIPTTEYMTASREKITTLAGFRASFQEHWALAYLPFMDSALGPLYQNYLYVQADHARRNQLPGFLSTAYDPNGVYRQMGIPAIAYSPVDRSDVGVFFATAMGMLISPVIGASWLSEFYQFSDFVTPYGALESVGRNGYADIFTADAKGMTLLAASGGVVEESIKYIQERPVPKGRVSMYVKMIELLHAKFKQMLVERNHEPVYFPTQPYPAPTENTFEVKILPLPDPGPVYNISDHLQSGHLHGKNVRSVGLPTLEQDVTPGKPFAFEYEIPAYFEYFDQWAFRGTYIDQAVRISDMRYLSVTIPTDSDPASFEIELKSDGITLAAAVIDTTKPGILSEDGQYKTLVHTLDPIPESDYKPFNYIGVALHDPRYLLSKYGTHDRKGTIHLQNISLSKSEIFSGAAAVAQQGPAEFEIFRFWRPTHGGLPFYKNESKSLVHFAGGKGWRGGYIPYTNLSKFNYLYLRVRNTEEGCNCFYMELKHEGDQLIHQFKIPIHIPPDRKWHIFEIAIPEGIQKTFNYFALSDPYAPFDLGAILLSQIPVAIPSIESIALPEAGKKPLECAYRPCVNNEA